MLAQAPVFFGDRPVQTGPFAVELNTFAPAQSLPRPWSPQPQDPKEDWDGMAIRLHLGETVTINHHVREGVSSDAYYVALDTDGSAVPINDPLTYTNKPALGWEYYNYDGSISYVAETEGQWVYIGTGFTDANTPGGYFTEVVVSPDNDNILMGTADNDILVGGNNDEVFIGGAGDDQLTGGNGIDQFRFENVSDGHDVITDFVAGVGGDVINLDALFDALGAAAADPRKDDVSLTNDGSDTTLRINPTTYPEFSILLEGVVLDTADVEMLITEGNLVVDQS